METIYPLISSSVKGPLGICHLPRLWLKILLFACGRLPEGYRHGEGGFDEFTCDNIGIDRVAFVAYIENEKPDYQQLEAWVRGHATKLDSASIAAHNEAILTRRMRDEIAIPRRAELNLTDTDLWNGVALNDLDDWACLHAHVAPKTTVAR
jgi:uncharacterized protein DUF5069